MTRFDPKAIVIAMLLSLALDVVGGIVLLAAFSAGQPLTADDAGEAVRAIMQGTGFLLASLIYGTATTAFGGYVASRLARAYPYFNAMAVGAIGIVLGLLLADDAPWWYDALAYLLSIPAAVAGGHVAQQRQRTP